MLFANLLFAVCYFAVFYTEENIKVAKNSDCGNIHTLDTSIVTPINVTTQIKLDIENICKCCNYKCRNIYNFNRHLLSAKHKKKCTAQTCENIETEINYKDMFIKMITENKELHKLLIDQQKQISELIPIVGNNNTIIGNNNNTTNNKNNFNINVFLNENCKDALTINEFIDNIKISMDNLMLTKNKGIVECINNILMENIKKLSLHERPIHCTDVKRETMYIKCDSEKNDQHDGLPHWVKDIKNEKIKLALEKISHVQNKALQQWVDENPNWENNSSKVEEYMILINKCTSDLTEDKREDKIIRNLCKEVYIDK